MKIQVHVCISDMNGYILDEFHVWKEVEPKRSDPEGEIATIHLSANVHDAIGHKFEIEE